MNPDQPSREQIETRITALLLGELPADEAALLRYTIAQDPALQKLHDELQATFVLVREAEKNPATAPAEKPAPLKLSTDRREKLLAHFKTRTPQPQAKQKPKDPLFWLKRIEMPRLISTLVVLVIAGFLLAMFLPTLSRSKNRAMRASVTQGLSRGSYGTSTENESTKTVDNKQFEVLSARVTPPLATTAGFDTNSAIAFSFSAGPQSTLPPLAARPHVVLPQPNSEPTLADETGIQLATNQFGTSFQSTPHLFGTSSSGGLASRMAFSKAPDDISFGERPRTLEQGLAQNSSQVVTLAPQPKIAPLPSSVPTQIVLPQTEPELGLAGQGGAPTTLGGGVSSQNVAGSVTMQPLTQRQELAQMEKQLAVPTHAMNSFDSFDGTTSGAIVLNGSIGGSGDAGGSGGALALNRNGTTTPLATDTLSDQLNQPQAQPQPAGAPPSAGFIFSDSGVSGSPAKHQIAGAPASAAMPMGQFPAAAPAAEVASETSKAESPERRFSSGLRERGTGAVAPNQFYRNQISESEDKKLPIAGDVPVTGKLFQSSPAAVASAPAAPPPPTVLPSALAGTEFTFYTTNAANAAGIAGSLADNVDEDGKLIVAERKRDLQKSYTNYHSNEGFYVPQAGEPGTNGVPLDIAAPQPSGNLALEEQYAQQAKDIQIAQAKVKQLGKELNPGQTSVTQAIEQTDLPLRNPAPNTPVPQPEILTSNNAFSTFAMNVSDVSFKFAEASLQNGKLPDTASIRSEEFINAFDYRDPEAAAGQPMAFTSELVRYPFAHNRDLLRFSIKTAAAGRQEGRPLNLVILLDTSGSMERADRVAIIHEALRVLSTQLHQNDIVSVVSFARTARLWADGVSGDKAGETLDKVSGITPEGGTNLEEAMRLAYETARRHYLANGINRVVLLTDGAANLGDVDPNALKQKVDAQRKQGIALDCFGIGWEDFNDDLLEQLSSNGDGRYAFLNSSEDASKDFAAKLAGALQVAAQDVKVQVEFNPQRVISYRQIGYATHQLTKQQFRDNTVAAGEIAAQEAGNALYTIETNPNGDGPIATVHVRYRIPDTQDYREHSWDVAYTASAPALEKSSPAMRLAATASAFSEWLAASPYAQEVTPDELLNYLSGVPEIYGADDRPKQLETMIREAKSLQGK